MTHRFIEHTADYCAVLEAPDLEGLLRAGADALYAIGVSIRRDAVDQQRKILFYAYSSEEALVRGLQELVYLLESEGYVAVWIELTRSGEDAYLLELSGYASTMPERASEVKAATYHGLNILPERGGLTATVVFDI